MCVQLLLAERTPASTQTVQPTPVLAPADLVPPTVSVPGPSRQPRRRGAVGGVQDADDEDSVGPAPAPAPPQQPDLTDAEVEARLKIENIRYKHDYQAYLPN